MKHPEQAALIARVREATGLDWDALAERVGVKTESLQKYAGGGQAAGKALLRELERVVEEAPKTTNMRADGEEPGIYRPRADADPAEPASAPHKRLGYILRHGTLEEIKLVRSALDTVWSQITARHEPPQLVRRRAGHRFKPLLGAIPAGHPQEAIEQADEFVSVPQALASKSDYALRVRGDSMTGRDLHDGDIVLLSLSREPTNRSVVAALIDETEVTLKTYVHKNGKVYLRSENPDYPPEIVPTRELRVQGVMVGKLV